MINYHLVYSFKSKMSTTINISDVYQFVNQSSFETVKSECEAIGICVKERTIGDKELFLLANLNESSKRIETESVEKETESVEKETGSIKLVNNPELCDLLKKQANGLIFDKESKKIVCMSQNKLTDIYTFDQVSELAQSNRDIRIEYCEDGTIIRLYYYGGKWNTATTRCIDASSSFWTSSKNFDTMFWECFDRNLLTNLDTGFTYVFVLLHRENRIVVKHNVNMLVYISRINNSTYIEDYTNQFRNVYGIKRPKIMSYDEFSILSRNINNYDCKFKRGILIKVYNVNTKLWSVFKYDFESYKIVKSIRGNVPQIRMRYLELLSKPESLQLLEQFYSEHNFMFTFIKASLLKLVKTVYKLYVESHIKHTVQVDDSNLYFRTLRQLHAQYKITNKPIGFTDVQEKIYSLDKMVIKRLLQWDN
jgi:hypothetical protein